MFLAEALRFTWDALRANRVRSLLTALGMIIGTASVILVVTIAVTGRDYILSQIEGVGSNLIWAFYEAGDSASRAGVADYLTLADMEAVRREVPAVRRAAAIIIQHEPLVIEGRERESTVLGASADYRYIRNLKIDSGRFFDQAEEAERAKVCLLTEPLARKLYGGLAESLGQRVKIKGLQFTVIGTFREGTETFGQSEITRETLMIPISVMRYFQTLDKVDQLYFSVARAGQVPAASERVREILHARHRPQSVYRVENLSEILKAASRIGLALTLVLVLISAITLLVSGVGIMNIMLVTVTERTREIGVKMAIGARRSEILLQFLTEAVFISVSGGLVGIAVGVAVPLSARLFVAGMDIPISGVSIAVAFGVSFLVGIVFGMIPANRASQLRPAEALRYE